MKFWQWLGLVIVLMLIGGILVRLTYILRTGRDMKLDAFQAVNQQQAGAGTTVVPLVATTDDTDDGDVMS